MISWIWTKNLVNPFLHTIIIYSRHSDNVRWTLVPKMNSWTAFIVVFSLVSKMRWNFKWPYNRSNSSHFLRKLCYYRYLTWGLRVLVLLIYHKVWSVTCVNSADVRAHAVTCHYTGLMWRGKRQNQLSSLVLSQRFCGSLAFVWLLDSNGTEFR